MKSLVGSSLRSQTRFVARTIKGAKPLGVMPGFIEPQLSTLRTHVPPGDKWIHEIKLDGYRVQAHVLRNEATLYTRNGHDWTKRFPTIAAVVSRLPVERLILDGEVIVEKDGRPNFSELQADLSESRYDRMVFYAFDILYLDGFDLRGAALVERKKILERLLNEANLGGPLLYGEHLDADGTEMLRQCQALGFEGVVSKWADAPYRSGRGEQWIKVKCTRHARFPIIGFIKHPGSVAALYLGKWDGKDLTYAGKVGTGFSRKVAAEIRRRLDQLVIPKSKLAVPIRKPMATWVEPKLWAEVDYRDITSDGLLRHSSFQGLFASAQSTENLTPRK